VCEYARHPQGSLARSAPLTHITLQTPTEHDQEPIHGRKADVNPLPRRRANLGRQHRPVVRLRVVEVEVVSEVFLIKTTIQKDSAGRFIEGHPGGHSRRGTVEGDAGEWDFIGLNGGGGGQGGRGGEDRGKGGGDFLQKLGGGRS